MREVLLQIQGVSQQTFIEGNDSIPKQGCSDKFKQEGLKKMILETRHFTIVQNSSISFLDIELNTKLVPGYNRVSAKSEKAFYLPAP